MFDASFLVHLHDTLREISDNQSISKPGLYLIGTPIGNLADMTLRALAAIQGMDVLFCEDTRVTRKLLEAYGISKILKTYHTHNEKEGNLQILKLVEEGKTVGLVSDAGMPLISDPGMSLVATFREKNLPVTVMPGASAGVTALVSSGLPSETFHFVGFLASKDKQRESQLKSLKHLSSTLIFYEAPHRLLKTLDSLKAVFGNRKASVARELTKKFEEVSQDSLENLLEDYKKRSALKGEFVVLVEGYQAEAPQLGERDEALKVALQKLSVKDAAQLVSHLTGQSKKDLYQRALELQNGPAEKP